MNMMAGDRDRRAAVRRRLDRALPRRDRAVGWRQSAPQEPEVVGASSMSPSSFMTCVYSSPVNRARPRLKFRGAAALASRSRAPACGAAAATRAPPRTERPAASDPSSSQGAVGRGVVEHDPACGRKFLRGNRPRQRARCGGLIPNGRNDEEPGFTHPQAAAANIRAARRAVDELALPELEHEERPQRLRLRVVARSWRSSIDCTVCGLEVAAGERARIEQHLAR